MTVKCVSWHAIPPSSTHMCAIILPVLPVILLEPYTPTSFNLSEVHLEAVVEVVALTGSHY